METSADYKPVFIGTDALQEVATQVGNRIIMGPAYVNPNLMERMGIEIVSGIQFKRIDYVLVRKGGTSRRKVIGDKFKNQLGVLTERKMTVSLSWNKFYDNKDRYTELPFGTDGRADGAYPLSEIAVAGVLATYAEDLNACLFFGDIDKEDRDNEEFAHSLYDGFHKKIAQDIEDGFISEANGNLVPLETIAAPADNDDSTPFDNLLTWYTKLSPRLRQQQRVIIYMSLLSGLYVQAGYENKHHSHSTVKFLENGNFSVPEMPNVEICATDDWGKGDKICATTPNNFIYGVDSLSNETFVDVKVGTDDDANEIRFQIQSKAGVMVRQILSSNFALSDGSLVDATVQGDYQKATLTVAANDDTMGSVTVDGAAYTTVKEYAEGTSIKLAATAKTGYTFSNWNNGKTDAEITIVATGLPMAYTAIFKASE